MPGGRLKQYGPGKPDGKADKGLLDQNTGTDVGAKLPMSIDPLRKYQLAPFAAVRGNSKGTSRRWRTGLWRPALNARKHTAPGPWGPSSRSLGFGQLAPA